MTQRTLHRLPEDGIFNTDLVSTIVRTVRRTTCKPGVQFAHEHLARHNKISEP